MSVTVNDLERKNFQAGGSDSVGNSIDVTMRTTRYLDGDVTNFNIEIENPWAGDTQSGFGQTCYIDIPTEDAIAMAKFILAVTNK